MNLVIRTQVSVLDSQSSASVTDVNVHVSRERKQDAASYVIELGKGGKTINSTGNNTDIVSVVDFGVPSVVEYVVVYIAGYIVKNVLVSDAQIA